MICYLAIGCNTIETCLKINEVFIMATKIRDIIDYYSGHNVPDEIKERVLDRISNTQDDKEANEAFRELWDKADSAYMEEEEISAAYNRLFETEETREIEKKNRFESSTLPNWLPSSYRC